MFTIGIQPHTRLHFRTGLPATLSAEQKRELPGSWQYTSGRYGMVALKQLQTGPYRLRWMHAILKKPVRLQELEPGPGMRLQLTLRGSFTQELLDLEAVDCLEGYNDLFYLEDFRQVFEFQEPQHAEWVQLDIPLDTWQNLVRNLEPLPVLEQCIRTGESGRIFDEPVACDLSLLHHLEPWRTYVPGQVIPDRIMELQLEAWVLTTLLRADTLKVPGVPLSGYDRSCLRDLRRIMDHQIDNLEPPMTEPELSQKVALNLRKLKAGFKAMFGSTISDYLRRQRMGKGLQLLLKAQLDIGEVARRLGYKQRRFFVQAFRKTFGVHPDYILSHHRIL